MSAEGPAPGRYLIGGAPFEAPPLAPGLYVVATPIGNQRHATSTEKLPFEWKKKVDARGHGMTVDDILSWEEEGDELLVMGLRLREGIDPRRFAQLSGRTLSDRQINELKSIGFVETLPNGFIRVTDKGWPVLDAVVADLAA